MPDELAEVYRQHVASVWRYARARLPDHADAEDVTSEVFARAARAWDRYDPARGSVGAWLAGIAHHVVADWWRRRPPEEPRPEHTSTVDHHQGDPADALVRFDDAAHLRRHLSCLTDREREAVALRFGAGLSSAEVGEVLGISDAGARMLVYRAVAKLRQVMADE